MGGENIKRGGFRGVCTGSLVVAVRGHTRGKDGRGGGVGGDMFFRDLEEGDRLKKI